MTNTKKYIKYWKTVYIIMHTNNSFYYNKELQKKHYFCTDLRAGRKASHILMCACTLLLNMPDFPPFPAYSRNSECLDFCIYIYSRNLNCIKPQLRGKQRQYNIVECGVELNQCLAVGSNSSHVVKQYMLWKASSKEFGTVTCKLVTVRTEKCNGVRA
jgi:hypothetical protein